MLDNSITFLHIKHVFPPVLFNTVCLKYVPKHLSYSPFCSCLSGVRVVHVVKLCHQVFCTVLWCPPRFPRKIYVRFVLIIRLIRCSCFIYVICIYLCYLYLFMLFVFIYVYWCPTWFQYHMMFVSLNSNTGLTCGRWTVNPSGAPEFTPGF